jgi:hypothetical protein
MNHYLIVFDHSKSAILRFQVFSARHAAVQAGFEAERRLGDNTDVDVVVIGAESAEALRRTNPRYFARPRPIIEQWG